MIRLANDFYSGCVIYVLSLFMSGNDIYPIVSIESHKTCTENRVTKSENYNKNETDH